MLVSLVGVSVGCGDHSRAPQALLDGSHVREPAVDLEGLRSQPLLTKVTVVSAPRVVPGSPEALCVERQVNGLKAAGVLVRRIGVWSESVTFRERAAIVGCDGTVDQTGGRLRWCGGSYGRLFARRLRDPRLDIAGCRTVAGEPAAFAWVEPRHDARYVSVAQPGYVEVYPVVRGVPVRVATASGVESDPIGATFDVSEYDARGRLLRAYRLMAQPAG